MTQLLGCLIVVAFATIMGFILFKVVDLIHPMRVTEVQEETGLDITQHDETLYERSRVEERVAVS